MFFDFLLIQLVIGPCNVLVWRGAWELYDRIFGMDGLTTGPLLFLAGFLLSIPTILFVIGLLIVLAYDASTSNPYRAIV